MVTIIIAIAIGIFINLWNELSSWRFEWSEIFWYLVISILGGLVGLVVGFIVALMLPMSLAEEKYSLKIEALQDGSSLSGHFFLGSGHIDGRMQYVFYYEQNGLYTLKQVDASDAKVKYTNEAPQVDVTKIVRTDSWINYFAIDLDLGDKTYIIEVPKGTINNSYNLDAQ